MAAIAMGFPGGVLYRVPHKVERTIDRSVSCESVFFFAV
jgi:hypothetical protein